MLNLLEIQISITINHYKILMQNNFNDISQPLTQHSKTLFF